MTTYPTVHTVDHQPAGIVFMEAMLTRDFDRMQGVKMVCTRAEKTAGHRAAPNWHRGAAHALAQAFGNDDRYNRAGVFSAYLPLLNDEPALNRYVEELHRRVGEPYPELWSTVALGLWAGFKEPYLLEHPHLIADYFGGCFEDYLKTAAR